MGNKNKMILKKEAVIVLSALLISSFANAQTVVEQDNTVLPGLTVRTESSDYLLSQNCDPNVMQSLNNDYIAKRQIARNMQLNTLVKQQVMLTPPPQTLASGSCYEQAANGVNSVLSTLDAIKKLFSGDIGAVGNQIKKAGASTLNSLACQQITKYTGQATTALNNNINGTVNGAIGQLNNYSVGALGQSINGGQILNTATGVNVNNYNSYGNSNNVPYITGNQIGSTVNNGINTLGGSVSTTTTCSLNNIAGCNPFK